MERTKPEYERTVFVGVRPSYHVALHFQPRLPRGPRWNSWLVAVVRDAINSVQPRDGERVGGWSRRAQWWWLNGAVWPQVRKRLIEAGVAIEGDKLIPPEEVEEVRELYASGCCTQRELALRFGLTRAGVRRLVRGLKRKKIREVPAA